MAFLISASPAVAPAFPAAVVLLSSNCVVADSLTRHLMGLPSWYPQPGTHSQYIFIE